MDWIDIGWTGMAAACLTLALIHLLVWNKQREHGAHIAFSLTAFAVATVGTFELALLRADSVESYATLLRWVHVPLVVLFAALVAFVRLHLGAGRAWLGHLAWGLRLVALIPDFTTGINLNYVSIARMHDVEAPWGASFMRPEGTGNPWMAVGQLSSYVLLAFFADAAISAWRDRNHPARAKVIRICSSLALFVLASSLWNLAVVAGALPMPLAVLPAFTCVLMVMGYELGGDVVRAAQLAKDLTLVQGTLRESEQRIEDAVLAAGFGLWDWHLVRRETWLSPRARELLDVADEPFTWGHFLQRIEPLDREFVQSTLDRVRKSGGNFLIECRVVHADNATRWLLVRGQAECGREGKAVRLRGVLVDATDRKRLEHESAVQRDELAHLSRVALLAELSGSLAHELNQPLTAILSNAQAAQRFMAQQPPDLDEVRESLANIVESDKRAGEVIRRLRAMLRKEPAEFRPIDLNEIVQDVLRIVRSDLLNKSVDVHLDLHPGLPGGEGDRVQLQQVLLNLIVNASDAMRERLSGRELTVATRPATAGGMEISVSDLGRGIPEADLERIFSPFVTSKADGMGLGLAVCRTIIDSHGGRLWASNNRGAGATLRFWLPASVAAAPAVPLQSLHQGAVELP